MNWVDVVTDIPRYFTSYEWESSILLWLYLHVWAPWVHGEWKLWWWPVYWQQDNNTYSTNNDSNWAVGAVNTDCWIHRFGILCHQQPVHMPRHWPKIQIAVAQLVDVSNPNVTTDSWYPPHRCWTTPRQYWGSKVALHIDCAQLVLHWLLMYQRFPEPMALWMAMNERLHCLDDLVVLNIDTLP